MADFLMFLISSLRVSYMFWSYLSCTYPLPRLFPDPLPFSYTLNSVSYLFVSLQEQLILPKCSWLCGLSLESDQFTRVILLDGIVSLFEANSCQQLHLDSVIIVEEGQRVRTKGAERLQENSISVRGKETAHINSLQLG